MSVADVLHELAAEIEGGEFGDVEINEALARLAFLNSEEARASKRLVEALAGYFGGMELDEAA